MKFRYRVTSRDPYLYLSAYTEYNITIQEYTSSIFHWKTVKIIELRQLLNKLHKDEFEEFEYYYSIPEAVVYDVLKKYNSMDEIIMKYITNVILKERRQAEDAKQNDNAIAKFVVTNGWKTIEIKENET
jgi:hypothetical protein